MSLAEWFSKQFFSQVHSRNLVYNTCWEDPRCDRQALEIKPDHKLLVITSAGCNTLDYLLDQPERVFAIDMNPRQNALLQLKMAAIRNLDYNTFSGCSEKVVLRTLKRSMKSIFGMTCRKGHGFTGTGRSGTSNLTDLTSPFTSAARPVFSPGSPTST